MASRCRSRWQTHALSYWQAHPVSLNNSLTLNHNMAKKENTAEPLTHYIIRFWKSALPWTKSTYLQTMVLNQIIHWEPGCISKMLSFEGVLTHEHIPWKTIFSCESDQNKHQGYDANSKNSVPTFLWKGDDWILWNTIKLFSCWTWNTTIFCFKPQWVICLLLVCCLLVCVLHVCLFLLESTNTTANFLWCSFWLLLLLLLLFVFLIVLLLFNGIEWLTICHWYGLINGERQIVQWCIFVSVFAFV